MTTVFTGGTGAAASGTGAAASGAGKAALAAKALTAAGKVGRIVDPMTYVFKGAGAGLSRIGDVMAGLKNLGKIETPPLPDNVFTLPDGWTRLPDGTLDVPAGATLPHGATRLPDGTVKLPDGTIALPEGTIKNPFDEGAAYADINGNLYDQHGNLIQKGEEAPQEVARTPTDTPNHTRTEPPAEQPALVGAGARVGDAAGDELGVVGQAGDNLPGNSLPDRTPGGMANNHLDNNTSANHPASNTAGANAPGNHGSGDVAPSANASENGNNNTGHPAYSEADANRGGHDVNQPATRAGAGTAPASQPTPRPNFMREGVNPYGPRDSLTLKQIEEIQVYRANHENGYFEKYYSIDGRRLRTIVTDESYHTPPQLIKETPTSPWIPASEAPPPIPERYFRGEEVSRIGHEAISEGVLRELDESATRRRNAIDYRQIAEQNKIAHSSLPEDSPIRLEAEARYRAAMDVQTKKAEAFGESVAELQVVPELYDDIIRKEALHGPISGNDQFDQVYRREGGRFVVVEAKSNIGTPLNSREISNGGRAVQGSREYFLEIIKKMQERGREYPSERTLANDLKTALALRKIDYILVKGRPKGFLYNGYRKESFDIRSLDELD